MNKPRRAMAKALSWEAFAFFLTLLIVYGMTGNLAFTLELSLVCQIAKIFFLYIHERVWDKIQWGRNND